MRLGKYVIDANLRALQPWTHFKLHRRTGVQHLVWGKLSVHIEDGSLPHYAICAVCHSPDIGEVFSGDEGLTVCQDCGSIEQGYKYLNLFEYEGL